jgi:two-component system, LuxR family, response regulator FixJ
MPQENNIYVIDDDPGMRESLHFLLEARGFAVEAYESARDFLAADGASKVGCLVIDVRMPDMTGLQLQECLAKQNSRLSIVLITGYADVAMAVGAMKAGAVDFIEKPFSDEALLDSIGRALEQSQRLSTHADMSAEIGERLESLTAREREVLDHLVTGSPHKVIGYALNISPRTIEIHRAHIMQKLEAHSLADLVRMMITATPGTSDS